jgi:hypothetical protein
MFRGKSGDGVGGGNSSGNVSLGRTVVAGVGAGTGGKFGDGTRICVCDAGVVRLMDG